jgi:tyrosyl-tRNA synthetase
VGKFLRRFTDLPLDEIARLEALQGSEINEAKKVLADEATKLAHGEEAAREAAETAKRTFEQGGAGEALPTLQVDGQISIVVALTVLASPFRTARRGARSRRARCVERSDDQRSDLCDRAGSGRAAAA